MGMLVSLGDEGTKTLPSNIQSFYMAMKVQYRNNANQIRSEAETLQMMEVLCQFAEEFYGPCGSPEKKDS